MIKRETKKAIQVYVKKKIKKEELQDIQRINPKE